jgi:hypothetical protein
MIFCLLSSNAAAYIKQYLRSTHHSLCGKIYLYMISSYRATLYILYSQVLDVDVTAFCGCYIYRIALNFFVWGEVTFTLSFFVE